MGLRDVNIHESNGDTIQSLVVDETNVFFDFLRNGGSEDQTVDGSSTPVVFSTSVVPAGKTLVISRLLIYMEDSTNFTSIAFGGMTALTNGWELSINGTTLATAKDNKTLATFMFDMTGDTLFGKENQTMVGRFSFSKFINGAGGLTIREGEVLSTIVNDDLTDLDFLNVMAQGYYTS